MKAFRTLIVAAAAAAALALAAPALALPYFEPGDSAAGVRSRDAATPLVLHKSGYVVGADTIPAGFRPTVDQTTIRRHQAMARLPDGVATPSSNGVDTGILAGSIGGALLLAAGLGAAAAYRRKHGRLALS